MIATSPFSALAFSAAVGSWLAGSHNHTEQNQIWLQSVCFVVFLSFTFFSPLAFSLEGIVFVLDGHQNLFLGL